jgi:2-polyprenyl-3-methyl-5-hydroxy-6-metoxy-1,4-benzoquinol methylase
MKNNTVKYDDYLDSKYSSINRIVTFIPENRIVLDLGCSTGYLGLLLKKKGCRMFGVESNPDAAQKAREEYEQVYVLDLDHFQGLNGDCPLFDVMVFGDVMEHLKNPWQTLQKLRSYLNDDGMMIISLPNVANWSMRFHLLRGKFEYVRYGVLDETHLRFFNLRSARELIEKAGFQIIDTDFTPGVDKLVPYRILIQRFLKHYSWYKEFEYRLTRAWPTLFSHQMIFVAKKIGGHGGSSLP